MLLGPRPVEDLVLRHVNTLTGSLRLRPVAETDRFVPDPIELDVPLAFLLPDIVVQGQPGLVPGHPVFVVRTFPGRAGCA